MTEVQQRFFDAAKEYAAVTERKLPGYLKVGAFVSPEAQAFVSCYRALLTSGEPVPPTPPGGYEERPGAF